ncbi:aldehyde dehydrogenase family protein, partial [Rhodococcus rhodochrous]
QAEMGGKNAAIVLADADLELAVEQVMLGAFRSTGQKCTANSRLVLHEPIAEEFLARLTVEVKELRVGDPLDPDVTTGPVVSASAQKSIIN